MIDVMKCLIEQENLNLAVEKIKQMTYLDETLKTPKHYDNSKGSIYQFCENQKLNSYEFDIIKRVVRCRKKGDFKQDLEKTKALIDLYLKENENNGNA
jgi:uncharacterized protein (UPF0335 family)